MISNRTASVALNSLTDEPPMANRQYAQDTSNNQPLEDYWEAYQIRRNESSDLPPDSPLESPISVRFKPNERPDASQRNRTFSDAMVLESASRPALTPFHPASSLLHLIDSFGPLIFPLYRAVLLRKRVLLMVEAPVHVPCNYGTPIPPPTQYFAWTNQNSIRSIFTRLPT